MPERIEGAADAIARARDLLAPEDEHLSARLDDVERAAGVADLDEVLALIAGALAARTHPRALEYRKLVAVQAAARARRRELTAPAPPADPATPPARPPASPSGWLGWLRSGSRRDR
ncbi:MAG TPA: hypothetical protein VGJ70_03780 [Solirubrobacteraceae bacterium]